jgi:hypothetical protein
MELAEPAPAAAPQANPCPSCGEAIGGAAASCPFCGESLQGSFARCPYCDEDLRSVRRACPHCGEDLSAAAEVDRATDVAEATRADAAAGRFQAAPPGVFRRFRTVTIGWTATLVVCAILIGIGAGHGSDSPLIALAVLGWIFGVLAFLIVLAFGIPDLLLLAPGKLTTPERTLKTYVKCLREKRWKYAWHLAVPRAREGTRRRSAIDTLKLEAGEFSMKSEEGLAEFWKPILTTAGGTVRNCQLAGVKAAMNGADDAVAGTTIKVTAYPTWVTLTFLISPLIYIVLYFVIRKTESLPVDLPLVRVAGRWYLVELIPHIPMPTK